MKKRLIYLLMVTVVALLCACAVGETEDYNNSGVYQSDQSTMQAPATEDPTDAPTEVKDIPELSFIPRYGIFGERSEIMLLDNNELATLQKEEAAEELGSYPVFENLYSYDPYGLNFEITTELISQEIAYGRSFLTGYYGAEADYNFTYDESVAPHIVSYQDDELSVVVNPWQISVRLKNGYSGPCDVETLMQLPLVQSAMEWKEIQNAEVSDIETEFGGISHTFIISEHRDDPVEQLIEKSFKAISVDHYDDKGILNIFIQLPHATETEERVTAASATAFDAFLAQAFPNDMPSEYVTEIFYSSKVTNGKYVPCYRIYIPEPDYPNTEGQTACSVIEVTTAEVMAADEDTSEVSVIQPPTIIEPIEIEETEPID